VITSFLRAKGGSGAAKRTLIKALRSNLRPTAAYHKIAAMTKSPVAGEDDKAIDNDSAQAMFARRAQDRVEQAKHADAVKNQALGHDASNSAGKDECDKPG